MSSGVPGISLLTEILQSLLQEATAFRDSHLHEASSYDELKEQSSGDTVLEFRGHST